MTPGRDQGTFVVLGIQTRIWWHARQVLYKLFRSSYKCNPYKCHNQNLHTVPQSKPSEQMRRRNSLYAYGPMSITAKCVRFPHHHSCNTKGGREDKYILKDNNIITLIDHENVLRVSTTWSAFYLPTHFILHSSVLGLSMFCRWTDWWQPHTQPLHGKGGKFCVARPCQAPAASEFISMVGCDTWLKRQRINSFSWGMPRDPMVGWGSVLHVFFLSPIDANWIRTQCLQHTTVFMCSPKCKMQNTSRTSLADSVYTPWLSWSLEDLRYSSITFSGAKTWPLYT